MGGSGPFVSLPFPNVKSSVRACLYIFFLCIYCSLINILKKRVENETVSYKISFDGRDGVLPSLIFVIFEFIRINSD